MVLGVDDLVVAHLGELLEALATHVAGVGPTVAVDLHVHVQLVASVGLQVTRKTQSTSDFCHFLLSL